MKKSFLNQNVLMLGMLLMVTAINAQSKTTTELSTGKNLSVMNSYSSDDSSGQTLIAYNDGKQNFRIKMRADKILELYVDDKKIPAEDYNKYQDAINKILLQIKKDKEHADQDRKKAMINQDQSKQDMERAYKQKQLAELDRQNAMKNMSLSLEDQAKAKKDEEKALLDAKHAEEDNQTISTIMDDLVKENIVSDSKSINSVELTSEILTVNGKKQSEELHHKFQVKFLKNRNTKINFNSRNFSISNDK